LIVVRPFAGASVGDKVKYSLPPAEITPADDPGEATE